MTAQPRLTLTLPGRWLSMPLEAPDAAEQLKAFAREAVGDHDRHAALRARLHNRLVTALDGARRGKAEQLHLGLMLTGDVPLPAAVTVYPSIAVATTQEVGAKAVMDAFVPRLMHSRHAPHGGQARASADDRVFQLAGDGAPDRAVLRTSRFVPGGDDAVDALSIDYWLTVPEHNRVQLMHVSIADAVASDLFVTLFDEIAFAARFAAEATLAERLRG